MNKLYLKNLRNIFFIAIIIFLIDFLTKFLALNYLDNAFVIIPNIIKLTLQYNSGVAFSIGVPYIMQILITPILLILLIYFVFENFNTSKWYIPILVGIILGGAVGNFVDRIRYGYVIDFISVLRFPVFNVADIAITVSIFIFALIYVKITRKN